MGNNKLYNIGLSLKESIILQLRIMLPTTNFVDLEKLFYVYLYQSGWDSWNENEAGDKSYLDYWVDNELCPNLNSARATETRLNEKGLIEYFKQIKNKKIKGLPVKLYNELVNTDMKITININLQEQ